MVPQNLKELKHPRFWKYIWETRWEDAEVTFKDDSFTGTVLLETGIN